MASVSLRLALALAVQSGSLTELIDASIKNKKDG